MRPTTGCYWSTAISSRSQNCYRVLGGPDQGRLRCGVRRSGATRRFDRTCNRRPVFLPRGCVERRGGRPMKSDYVRELVCHRNCELLIAHPWEVTASGRLASSSEIVALTVLPSCLSNAFTAAFVAGPTAAQAPNCPSCMVSIMSLDRGQRTADLCAQSAYLRTFLCRLGSVGARPSRRAKSRAPATASASGGERTCRTSGDSH
ncbi:MAG: hypothetical protein QOI87_1919 [Bradyrhizobium sp.]|jgi:hypothetical protein|nr:hypothetical protein [Bradyrhizobium sp.]